MPAGEAFSARQQDDVVRAIRLARQQSDLRVSVYVGTLEGDSRATALLLHGALGEDAAQSVLVAVDPGARRVEVVTGPEVRRRLDDRAAGLAAMTMTSAFQAGDLAGGIASGVLALAEQAQTAAVAAHRHPVELGAICRPGQPRASRAWARRARATPSRDSPTSRRNAGAASACAASHRRPRRRWTARPAASGTAR